jgi:hypothetical protein
MSCRGEETEREKSMMYLTGVGIPVKLNDDSGGKPNGVPE